MVMSQPPLSAGTTGISWDPMRIQPMAPNHRQGHSNAITGLVLQSGHLGSDPVSPNRDPGVLNNSTSSPFNGDYTGGISLWGCLGSSEIEEFRPVPDT